MKLTEGRGADVILEMLANVNLAKDLTVVAKYGRVVVIGNRGTIEINPRDAMGRDATVLGMALWNSSDRELASLHAAIGAGLAGRRPEARDRNGASPARGGQGPRSGLGAGGLREDRSDPLTRRRRVSPSAPPSMGHSVPPSGTVSVTHGDSHPADTDREIRTSRANA